MWRLRLVVLGQRRGRCGCGRLGRGRGAAENEQDEKERKSEDWTRDDAICGILTEVRELAEAR